jgi:hypothetical protein
MRKFLAVEGAVAALAFCVVTGVAAPSARAQASNSADNWEAMTKCAAIADADARHDCSDDVLREAGLLGAAPVESSRPRTVSSAPGASEPGPSSSRSSTRREPASPAPSSPAPAPKATADVRKDFGIDTPPPSDDESNRIEVTLTQVEKAGDGKLIVTTSEGAVWRQLFTDAMMQNPKVGESMRVRKNALGGYMCRIGKWPSFKCKRTS